MSAEATSPTLDQWFPLRDAQCASMKPAFNAPFNQAASFITLCLLCISDFRFPPSGPQTQINTCSYEQAAKLLLLFRATNSNEKLKTHDEPGEFCGLRHGGGLQEKPGVPWEAAACRTSLMWSK